MSLAIPNWAQSDVASIRQSRTLGEGANRQALSASEASQMDQMFSGSMDTLVQIDETDMDLARGQRGVVKMALPEMPGIPSSLLPPPPETRYEGDKTNGSSVMEMTGQIPMVTVTDYSPTSVDTIVVLGGPMAGTQLTHIDRANPENSYTETKGQVWNLMGDAMKQAGMGGMMGGLPGFG